MSILRGRREAPPVESRAFSLQQLGLMVAQQNGAPAVGTVDEALKDAATWACLHVKARSIAQLPVDVIQYRGDRRIPVAAPQIVTRPGPNVRRRVWVYQLAHSLFSDGNAFGVVVDVDAMQRPTSIMLLNPADVTDRRVIDGMAKVRINGGETRALFPAGDIWHMPGEVVQGGSVFGLSPVLYGARTTGTALAAERFGGQFFTDGGHPTWLIAPERDPGPDGAKAIKSRFLDAIKGNREPIVVPQSTTVTQLSVNPNDSQFLDLMRFTVEQTARRHGVPPNMVYAAMGGQNITYANVTQADLHYLKHTLSYPIDLIEEAWSEMLQAPRIVRFNRDAILRGDLETRWRIHDLRLKNKTTSINAVRALEDEEPFDGDEFDEPGIPIDAAEPAPTDPGEDDARSITVVNNLPAPPAQPVTVNVPASNVTVEPAHVNVTTPDVRVEPARVEIGDVHVAAPVVNVDPPTSRAVVRHIERDDSGQIVRIREEEI